MQLFLHHVLIVFRGRLLAAGRQGPQLTVLIQTDTPINHRPQIHQIHMIQLNRIPLDLQYPEPPKPPPIRPDILIDHRRWVVNEGPITQLGLFVRAEPLIAPNYQIKKIREIPTKQIVARERDSLVSLRPFLVDHQNIKIR